MDTYLQSVLQEMEAATAGISESRLAEIRAAEGKWSAAEVLEHLRLTFTSTAKLMERAAATRSPLSRATLRQWMSRMVVVQLGYMPSGTNAPDFARPGQLPPDIRNAFRNAVKDMDRAMEFCERVRGTTEKIAAHPILGPLGLNEWRKFHLVHTKHHMAQILRMRQGTTR